MPNTPALKARLVSALLVGSAAMGMAACTTPLTSANVSNVVTAPVADTSYRLGGGDTVAISVFGETDITGTYPIDAAGAVSLPLVGRVDIGGRTPQEAERILTTRLAEGVVQDPRVSISVVEYRPFYVVGEVSQPGAYSFFNGFTILNALALAGGHTYRADLSNIAILRSTADGTASVPVGDSVRRAGSGNLAAIQPGDVIIVPERIF